MSRVGYHCSHEQHAPSALLEHAQAAQRAGFAHAMCSDHLVPWNTDHGQGHSGFAWSWLGAAMATTSMTFGTVNAPGQRYHPVVIAHAIATLGEMFPDRFWAALGSGEALNEHVTGEPWPTKSQRRARLRECVDVIRALLRGETVNHDGLVRVHDARLYTRPRTPPPLIGAALTVETARWAGAWADGLITTGEPDTVREIADAFRDAAGARKPVYLQVALAHAATDDEAERVARAWRFAAIGDSNFKADVTMPAYFDAASEHVSSEALRKAVRVSADRDQHVAWIARDLELVDRVYVHHVGPTTSHQDSFMHELAAELLRL
jgi:coenzyme F420-dependent glucose-6-phosphate dehydrogenase